MLSTAACEDIAGKMSLRRPRPEGRSENRRRAARISLCAEKAQCAAGIGAGCAWRRSVHARLNSTRRNLCGAKGDVACASSEQSRGIILRVRGVTAARRANHAAVIARRNLCWRVRIAGISWYFAGCTNAHFVASIAQPGASACTSAVRRLAASTADGVAYGDVHCTARCDISRYLLPLSRYALYHFTAVRRWRDRRCWACC